MLRGVGGAPCEGCPYPDMSHYATMSIPTHTPLLFLVY